VRELDFDFENHPKAVHLSGAGHLKLTEVCSHRIAITDEIDTFHKKSPVVDDAIMTCIESNTSAVAHEFCIGIGLKFES
jgi:hypothetical protein